MFFNTTLFFITCFMLPSQIFATTGDILDDLPINISNNTEATVSYLTQEELFIHLEEYCNLIPNNTDLFKTFDAVSLHLSLLTTDPESYEMEILTPFAIKMCKTATDEFSEQFEFIINSLIQTNAVLFTKLLLSQLLLHSNLIESTSNKKMLTQISQEFIINNYSSTNTFDSTFDYELITELVTAILQNIHHLNTNINPTVLTIANTTLKTYFNYLTNTQTIENQVIQLFRIKNLLDILTQIEVSTTNSNNKITISTMKFDFKNMLNLQTIELQTISSFLTI